MHGGTDLSPPRSRRFASETDVQSCGRAGKGLSHTVCSRLDLSEQSETISRTVLRKSVHLLTGLEYLTDKVNNRTCSQEWTPCRIRVQYILKRHSYSAR